MKTLIIRPEYGCSLVRINDESGLIESYSYPHELLDKSIIKKLDYLNRVYENLFINNEYEFTFIGFRKIEDAYDFLSEIDTITRKIKNNLGDLYVVLNEFTINDVYITNI